MGAPSAPHCSPSTRALLLLWCSQDTGNRLLSSLPCCSHSPAAFPRESRSGATRPHSPCRGVCCLPTWQCPHAGLKGQHPKETSAQSRSVAGQLKGQASLPSCQACHPGRRCCFTGGVSLLCPPGAWGSLQRGSAPTHYCRRYFHRSHETHSCGSLPAINPVIKQITLLPQRNGINFPSLLSKHQQPLFPSDDALRYQFAL